MTEKFGTGRFCCRSCANSHSQTEEQNTRRSETIRRSQNYISKEKKKQQIIDNYNLKPNKCCICKKALNYNQRKHQTCSEKCKNLLLSQKAKENHFGGITKGHGTGRGGYYKGIRCDSRYELIYLVYSLDHGLNIIRNKEYFYYTGTDNKLHKYYPDFYISNTNTYIEVKGYFQENTQAKLDAVSKLNINFQILYWDNIKLLLPFIKEKYGLCYETIDKLYDICK